MSDKTARIEEIRVFLGLSKGEFAAVMGVDPQYYSHILAGKGKGNLRLEHLENLLIAKRVNPAWVMTGEGEQFVGETGADRPQISADVLRTVISNDFPDGWETTWLNKVVDAACEKVVSEYSNLSLLEMKYVVLTLTFAVYAQINALLESQNIRPGDHVNLNLEGVKVSFRR